MQAFHSSLLLLKICKKSLNSLTSRKKSYFVK